MPDERIWDGNLGQYLDDLAQEFGRLADADDPLKRHVVSILTDTRRRWEPGKITVRNQVPVK